MKNKTLNQPESLDLFHGTLGLYGPQISIRSGSGVGWNKFTLGDGFYTSPNLSAAMLFSHLLLQKSSLEGKERYDNHGFAKVYKISLNKYSRILDADNALDAKRVRGILQRSGVSKRYLAYRNDDQLTDFYKSADLLCYGAQWEGNRNEHMCRQLGYDGLQIKERAWNDWDYFPDNIGVDWKKELHDGLWPPLTLAVYNPSIISSFELYRDGNISNRDQDFSFEAGR